MSGGLMPWLVEIDGAFALSYLALAFPWKHETPIISGFTFWSKSSRFPSGLTQQKDPMAEPIWCSIRYGHEDKNGSIDKIDVR